VRILLVFTALPLSSVERDERRTETLAKEEEEDDERKSASERDEEEKPRPNQSRPSLALAPSPERVSPSHEGSDFGLWGVAAAWPYPSD